MIRRGFLKASLATILAPLLGRLGLNWDPFRYEELYIKHRLFEQPFIALWDSRTQRGVWTRTDKGRFRTRKKLKLALGLFERALLENLGFDEAMARVNLEMAGNVPVILQWTATSPYVFWIGPLDAGLHPGAARLRTEIHSEMVTDPPTWQKYVETA